MTMIYMPEGHNNLESFLCSVGQEEDCLEVSCLDGNVSDMLNSMDIVSESSRPELKMGFSMMPRSSETSRISSKMDTQQPTLDMWMSSVPGFHVNHSVLQGKENPQPMIETCGPKQSVPFALLNQDMFSSKMSEVYLVPWISPQMSLFSILVPFLETWPKAGMMQDGACYRRAKWELPIKGSGYGLWPTPSARDWKSAKVSESTYNKNSRPLNEVVHRKIFPTPTTVGDKGGAALCKWGGAGAREKLKKMVSPKELNGALNPEWVEWLMGWPVHWTSLESMSQDDIGHWRDRLLTNFFWYTDPAELDEPDKTPRISKGVKERRNKLKAIGNGQVPLCTAVAWKLLMGD